MSEAYSVLLVYATSHALKAEKILQANGITTKLIPVPRHLSSDCGVCVRILQIHKKQAQGLIETAQLSTAGIHDI